MVQVYVSQDLIDFLAKLFGSVEGDGKYQPLFDINKDGTIDVADISWFALRSNTWVELGGDPIWVKPALALGSFAGGLILGKIIRT
jgi:hypothetical protein